MNRLIARSSAIAFLSLAAAACGPAGFPDVSPPPAGLPEAEAIVYLIGDAGGATWETPILVQLKAEVAARSRDAEVAVAFLGDNIYEKGMHEPSHLDYEQDVERLEIQISVVRRARAKGLFIPGNHDWGYGDQRGPAQIRRQEAYLAEAAAADVALVPPAACPGPEPVPVAESVLLVAIETDLWLRDVSEAETRGCRHKSTEEALDALGGVLRDNAAGARRHIVMLAHHPLKTYGRHGGYFGLKEQFFPATELWGALYIPIPFLYPIFRNSGISVQDMSSPRNTRMREQFAAVFAEFADQPLVWAGGHDHNLQVFKGDEYNVDYILVSGAGSRLTPVGKDDALFAIGAQQREMGYMRLEFLKDGRVLLSVITDGTASCGDACPGQPTVRYWRWLAGR